MSAKSKMNEAIIAIQQYCLDQLAEWEKDSSKTLFSWPMDRISDKPYGYAIHCSIIEDWNKEDRMTLIGEFHRAWLTSIDNIEKALGRKWD